MASPSSSSRPRKRYGQHFLHDPAVIRRIIEAIDPQPRRHIVEIGPGRGALTRPLLEAGGQLDVIEIDRDLAALLAEQVAGARPALRVHCADVLRFRFDDLARTHGPLQVVGNLPYNISTPLLFHLLGQAQAIDSMVFMLQKEVAERIAAAPGGRSYGRLSVMIQYHCRIQRLFQVGPGAFTPPPKVDSTVLRLTPFTRESLCAAANPAGFAQLVAKAFAGRRKTLRNALKSWLTEEDFRALQLDPTLRAESLPVDEFIRMANRKDAQLTALM
ncbi:MAG: 16S rRNA (adenine(1518)-N(6)/adenine(1519)-N(6))-dimethyltransferase RsmA [Chromatiales bacterium]